MVCSYPKQVLRMRILGTSGLVRGCPFDLPKRNAVKSLSWLISFLLLSSLLVLAAEEQVLEKFSPSEFQAKVAGATDSGKAVEIVSIGINKPLITKQYFGFKGVVDYDQVELGGLEIRATFEDGTMFDTMTQAKGYKWIRGSAKGQAFLVRFDFAGTGESPDKLKSIKLRAKLPEGGSITIKSLELVQW